MDKAESCVGEAGVVVERKNGLSKRMQEKPCCSSLVFYFQDEAKKKEVEAKKVIQNDVEDLERTLQREGVRAFLKMLYRKWPPKNGQVLGDLGDRSLERTLKSALVAYHHDKQDQLMYGVAWTTLCTQICSMINNARTT